jgi:hypothetical protein
VIQPILIDKQSPFLGEECALCKELFSPGEELIVCPQDGTRHHRHCWQANGNRCTAYGCGGAGEVAPTAGRERPTIIEQQPERTVAPPRQRETAVSAPSATGQPTPNPETSAAGRAANSRSTPPGRATPAGRSTPAGRTTGCGQGCILLAIALAIVLISIACFGLWAMADYIMLEILEWNYRLP